MLMSLEFLLFIDRFYLLNLLLSRLYLAVYSDIILMYLNLYIISFQLSRSEYNITHCNIVYLFM